MGNVVSSIATSLTSLGGSLGLTATATTRVAVIGLDEAGKTTIVYKLDPGDNPPTVPTFGFRVETYHSGRLELNVWDVGGPRRPDGSADKFDELAQRQYFVGSEALIFVVDSANPERFERARYELQAALASEHLADGVSLLVFANKQDLPGAADAETIASALALEALEVEWHVQPCCALSGDGLYDGFEWLSRSLRGEERLEELGV